MPAKCDLRLTHQDADRFMCAVRFWVSALRAAIRPVPVHDVDDTGALKSSGLHCTRIGYAEQQVVAASRRSLRAEKRFAAIDKPGELARG